MDLVILNHGQVTRTPFELAPSSPNYRTNGRMFDLSTDLTYIAPLHGRSLMVLGSNAWHYNFGMEFLARLLESPRILAGRFAGEDNFRKPLIEI
ncbi:hypothetical protein TNCV_4144881 [Trichonephila clavipes]|nr:hypothetical protein TNCV_4144881 [Trichonephila clavipes]